MLIRHLRTGLALPAVAALGLAAPAGAQIGTPADGPVLEEVLVTGSRIKRQDYESISPLVTLSAEQITLSGVTAVEDLVNEAPQLVPDFDRSSNNPGASAAALNLRGLGSNRTLVTLNGRRMAPADEFGAVDVNVIPSRLIQRVEIVTGGASTVYGSDAVAGVVNFILDDSFTGFEVNVQQDIYGEGDGEVLDISAAFGIASERGHLSGFVNLQDREPLLAGEREFTAVRLNESFTPGAVGELRPSGSSTTPAGRVFFPRVPFPGSGGAPVELTFDPDGTPRIFNFDDDQFNFQPGNYLQTPLERQSAALFGRYRVADTIEVFGELLYSQTQATSQLASPPAFVPVVVNVDNPLLTAAQRDLFAQSFDPDGDGFAEFGFARRLEETGARRLTRDADSLRAVLGIEGEIGGGWDWTATVSSSRVRGDTITDSAVFVDRFTQGLLVDPATGACVDPSDGCVPFNPFGLEIPGAAVDFLLTGPIQEAYSLDEDIVTLAFTGDAWSLPAGPIGVAVGAEWRELSSEAAPDPRFLGGGVLGYLAGSPVGGTTNVAEAFVEVLVPLLSGRPFADYLGLEGGYRYSDYRFSGVADNWKIGVDWSPVPALRLRAMAQRAIRAPNIDELFRQPREQPSTLFSTDVDRCSASQDPVGNGLADLCIAQGIPAEQLGVYEAQLNFPITAFEEGGNTALEPEAADTLTAGIVIQPPQLEALSLSVDYYRIEIDNAIGSTSLEEAISLCFDSNDPGGQFCQSLRRAPSGDIAEYTNPQFNLSSLRVEGIDVAVNYRLDLAPALALFDDGATLALTLLGNYAMENALQQTPTSAVLDCAGFYAGACAFASQQLVPEYRSSTRLTYTTGPLTLGLNWQWIGGIANHLEVTCRDFQQFCYPSELGDIDSRSYVEVSGRFAIGDHGEIYGGVSNVFEEDPPLMGFGAQQSNTAPQVYDVFGRRFFLGLRYRL